MTENTKKNREKIEAEVREKVDCEEKAFRWVEHLALVDKISEDELSKMMSEIMLCHYNDINEERAISKVCGYPLCNVKLGKRSQHKYHISTKHNKVIDLSVRENFCSLYCYQANKYIENQIPQDPVWLRDGKPVDVKLMEKKSPKVSDIGEVPLTSDVNISINEDNENLDENDNNEDDEDDEDKHIFGLDGDIYQNEKPVNEIDTEVKSESINRPIECRKTNASKQTKLIDNKDVTKNKNTVTQHFISKITELLNEWFTKKSFQHLKLLLNEFYDSDDDPDDGSDDKEGNFLANSANFQSKVMNFLSRQPEWISESNISQTEEDQDKDVKNRYTLPSVDSRSQNSIRRRIVHEKLNGSLREVLPICGLLEEDLTEVGFFKLVDTFNFTSRNIVLNLKEWMVMTVVLLKMISKTYQKDFGNMMKRHIDINEFLIIRSLPNISQVDEIIKTVLDNFNKIVVTCENKVKEDGLSERVDYYYDNMEEVD